MYTIIKEVAQQKNDTKILENSIKLRAFDKLEKMIRNTPTFRKMMDFSIGKYKYLCSNDMEITINPTTMSGKMRFLTEWDEAIWISFCMDHEAWYGSITNIPDNMWQVFDIPTIFKDPDGRQRMIDKKNRIWDEKMSIIYKQEKNNNV